ncbi:NAD(+)/NADH kinase [Clostridium sp. LIBA-8841]|uniref:NAD(+)/NADH kinase n=1 Tax=Clostridium sp. LIBA-8841 TaxID=2987530 RepID=UPI002AC3E169|nr:NAD(+)/NADH kinase [Clostridium sp. LIBA-8841]MDZ5252761.1 NAD(+)/NADH kinase [Clostridium sp. LIBA-8841]
MKNIGIIINKKKDKENRILDLVMFKVEEYLKPDKVWVIDQFYKGDYEKLRILDLLIVLGGDGTLLGVARKFSTVIDTPILGINIGNLGFLVTAEISELEEALYRIRIGDYKVEERMLLSCTIEGATCSEERALNDIVVARGTLSRMAQYEVFINDELYATFKGDGVIISTPVGSTAYSFSAGGPLIMPDLQIISIVPICAHTPNSRPMIIDGNNTIRVKPLINESDVFVTIDGQKALKLEKHNEVLIKKAKEFFRIISFDNKSYFKVLRKKLFKIE